MPTRTICLLVLLSASLTGCATIRPRAGFTEVERLVAQRTSAQVSWSDGVPDPAVEQRVTELLRGELTAGAAVQIALLNNRKLQAVYNRLGIAQADVVQAGLPPNPILVADVHPGTSGPGLGVEIGFVTEFISIVQIPLRKRVATAAFDAAKLEVAQAVWDLATQVKAAFYRLQGAAQILELRRTVAQATALSAEVAQRQHQAGNNTDLELANEQALDDDAKLDLAEAEVEVESAREELNSLMGLWGADTAWTLSPRLPEVPAQELAPQGLESKAMEQRLDLAAARQQVQVLSRTAELTRLYRLLPTGEAGVSAHREPEDGFWSTGPSLTLPVPIFDQRQAVLASNLAQVRQAEEQFAAMAVDIRAEVRRQRVRMQAARRRAEYCRMVALPRRQRVVGETQKEYNAMLVGVFQLLQAKRDEVETARKYIDSLTGYWVSRADLERAVGAELPVEDASPPPASLPSESTTPPVHHNQGG